MGSAIGNNLLESGHDVWGFDPDVSARKRFSKIGAQVCPNAARVIERCEVILTSLPNSEALFDAVDAVIQVGKRNSILIETSTLLIEDKVEARLKLKKKGIHMLDCPLSGTGAQAVTKDLTVYASGSTKHIQFASPIFMDFAKEYFDLGEFGNGMKMKLIANLLVAIHNVSTAEALLMSQRFNIPIDRAVEVLSGGAGGSKMLKIRGPMMNNQGWKRATMKVGIWQKDMKLIGQALRHLGVPAPLFSATEPIYNAAMSLGHADHDTASVFDVLDRMSRLNTV